MKAKYLLTAMLILCLGTGLANAATKTINISSYANNSWCGDLGVYNINCKTFPYGTQHYNGIPFLLSGDKAGTENNAWFSDFAAGGGSSPVSVTIPINVAKVKTVYTLMNTIWGSTQPGLLSVTFTGSAGATWTFDPIGGVNVRDANNSSYTDTCICQLPGGVAQSATINAWVNNEGQRLDEQIYELPAAFATQTLVSITITDSGNEGVQRSFLAAVTVSTTGP
ncbi:MAG: hypothetical protein WAK29_12415 [Terriglobales bacterium]